MYRGDRLKKWWNILQTNRRMQMAVCGILLGFLLLWWGNARRSESVQHETEKTDSYFDVKSYTENLEKRIADLCVRVDGVREAHVLLTLDGGSERRYETGGGTWLSSSTTQGEALVQEVYPRIRGVAVVCTGGNDSEIRLKITELISAALGISTSRVYVVGK